MRALLGRSALAARLRSTAPTVLVRARPHAQLVFDAAELVARQKLSGGRSDCAVAARRVSQGGLLASICSVTVAAYEIDTHMDTPFEALPEAFKGAAVRVGRRAIAPVAGCAGRGVRPRPFEGVIPSMQRRYSESEIDEVRESCASS